MAVDWLMRFDAAYRFMRVDRKTGLETAQIYNVLTGGTLERNQDTDVKESGSIEVIGDLDIGNDFIRVYLDAVFADGSSTSECLGTYIASITSRTADGSTSRAKVNLYGKLKMLVDNEIVEPIVCKAGVSPFSYVLPRLYTYGRVIQRDLSSYTLPTTRYYGISTTDAQDNYKSELSMCNDLLAQAGFNSVSCDVWGNFVLTKATQLTKRSSLWTFEEGKNARFLRSVEEVHDISDVANKVYAVYTKDKDTVVGLATDNDPKSPYSIATLGRVISARYDYQGTATQAEANAKAQALLDEARSVIRRETLTHVYAPITIGDAVDLVYTSAGIKGKFAVRTQRFQLKAGCICESEVRAFER